MRIHWLDSTPDLLALHRFSPSTYPFLLESAVHGTPQARYDILFAQPGEALTLEADGSLEGVVKGAHPRRFIDALDQWWAEERADEHEDTLPFRGGWFIYLGYELAGELEPTLRLPAAPGKAPVACAVRVPAAVIVDHAQGRSAIVAERDELLPAILEDLAAADRGRSQTPVAPPTVCIEEDPAQRYLDGVLRCKRYIRDGDVFQVNLSRAWRVTPASAVDAATLYAQLRAANPAPFAGLADFGAWAVVSSSPERLVRVHDRQVETRPIAGTRPRGNDAAADADLSRELLAHPKERAEHVMLIDLERNDLGRVCEAGSVRVDELMTVESYSHVHHIVSNVSGRLRPEVTPGQVIRAVFPGGTITGCPKVRCMEIIAELEQVGRGAYTGALGYLNRNGDMDLNILIRTMVQEEGAISFRTGAGIVADSDPEAELVETRHKARGLIRAVQHGAG